MTEEEARDALFNLHYEYMLHTPKERLKLYDEYRDQREYIKSELARTIREKKEGEMKTK